MFSLAHYWLLRAGLLPGSVRGISGRALDKYSFDGAAICLLPSPLEWVLRVLVDLSAL